MKKIPFVPSTGIERQFAWIASIPHGSREEKALSDAIRIRAEASGLEAIQDALGNLLVRKPASAGFESRPSVILQAHLDMVCTRDPESHHNFHTDPLTLWVDDQNWLHADGTTLGADDGYGVSYMLQLLFDETAPLPELECLFTVQEEIGLIGAASLDTSMIRSRRMISMDSGGEHETTVSTAGGRRVTFSLPLAPISGEGRVYLLNADGMTGGHSAGEIHRGRANAIKVLSTTLLALAEVGAVLVDAQGGEADNAIPRYARAHVRIPDGREAEAQAIVEKFAARYHKLHAATDPEFSMVLEPSETDSDVNYSLACMRLPVAMFDGVRYTDPTREGVLALSSNLGLLSAADGKLVLHCMIRSISPEYRDVLSEQLVATGEAFGASYAIDSDYPGMEYDPHSKMRAFFAEAVRQELGRDIVESSTHGGMEIGYFYRSIPGVDIVTLGPFAEGCHSPSEKMDLPSFNRMYALLVRLLTLAN